VALAALSQQIRLLDDRLRTLLIERAIQYGPTREGGHRS